MRIHGFDVDIARCDAVVVGSGAAGLSAACRLREEGKSVIVVTEGLKRGTSMNAGSDKQTYYTTAVGDGGVKEAARRFFEGGAMHGDHAMLEAALSARCFYYLVESGVKFPHDAYGLYAGYRTDHDTARRATSVGPLTSRRMAEALARRAFARGATLMDGRQAVDLLLSGGRVAGVLAFGVAEAAFTIVLAGAVVWATGGPAGLYGGSAYPEGQTGALGVPLLRGARCVNLCEGQFGIASVFPRWNLSGSYQQALPRYISVDGEGVRREFLSEAMPDLGEVLSMVFLKGYQWPFDVRKLGAGGSSRVDLLVERERRAGRRVYLDFTRNARDEYPLPYLDGEARAYLNNCGAAGHTPYERLLAINPPAAELYRGNGIDLSHAPLEIAVAAQHMNGGLEVDEHWRATLPGLYAVGETAGTHGVYRPGGSALNSGQAGALRAARHIARSMPGPVETVSDEEALAAAEGTIALAAEQCARTGGLLPEEALLDLRARTDAAAGIVRRAGAAQDALREAQAALSALLGEGYCDGPRALGVFFHARDHLIAQGALFSAVCKQAARGLSGGSALIPGDDGEKATIGGVAYDIAPARDTVLTTALTERGYVTSEAPVRPMPEEDDWFENVWRAFRRSEGLDND